LIPIQFELDLGLDGTPQHGADVRFNEALGMTCMACH